VPRFLLLTLVLVLVVVAAIASPSTGNWWFLGVVLALHLVAFLIAMTPVMRALEGGDKP
jgi:membrane protein implicated in regulation of membrane protease activity